VKVVAVEGEEKIRVQTQGRDDHWAVFDGAIE
jgi:hypothetical protein